MQLRARMRRRRWLQSAMFASAVIAGVPESAYGQNATPETYTADDGSLRVFRNDYAEGYRPGRREPHYVRAAGEMVGLLAAGWALYYFKTADHSNGDYSGAGERIEQFHVTFDTNTFDINALGHPAGGSMYHLFARTNGLSIPASFLYSTLSSAAWEAAFEITEKPSINDLIITPVAGVSVGEVLVRLGDYFNSAPRPRWYHSALGLVFGPIHRLHRWIDGYEPAPSTLPPDRLGFSSFYTHRFDLLVGPTDVANDIGSRATALQLRFNAEIVSMPGFLRPGRFSHTFKDGEFIETLVQTNIGETTNAWDLRCDANLFGRYAQDLSARGGHASMFAFNTAVRYATRSLVGRPDNYFVANAGGPAFKLWAVASDFTARLEGSAHFDFALVRSLAFSEFAASFGESDVASVLREHDYYYGVGFSGQLRGLLRYKFLEVGARTYYGHYESIDGMDRFPHEVPRSIHATDNIAELEGWLGLVPRKFPLQVRAFFERLPRSSWISTISTTRWDQRWGITIGALL